MKILLTTLNAKHIHSSLALRYLESYARDTFPNITVQEYTINQDFDYILSEIYKGDYQVICCSCYIWNSTATLELVTELKKVSPELKVILGGPEVSFDPVELMDKHQAIDYIVVGEGEVTFKELLAYILEGKGTEEAINGLAYRQGNCIQVTEPRALIADLAAIPFPYEEDLRAFKNKIIYYESSRGCPFGCSYCLSSTIRGVRFFPLERIKKDLQFFLAAQVNQVKFVDRTFNAKRSHSLEIMRFLHENDNGHTNFHFEITADLLDEETLNFLAGVRTGLFQFEIGVQSTNPDSLTAINRAVDFQKLKVIVKKLTDFGNIHLHLDLIAGLPYEDFSSFKKSFNDVYALEPGMLQLGFLKLLKGTSIRAEKTAHGYLHKELPPYEVLANNYISFKEMLRLKGMERMLELYYNAHGFTYTVEYLLTNFYPAPAEFYQELSEYWEEQGYHHEAHAKAKLYGILLEFYSHKNFPREEFFMEILKLDFLNNNKNRLPEFLPQVDPDILKNDRYNFLKEPANVARYLPKYVGQSAKNILKKVHFELFTYDVQEIIANPTKKDFEKQLTTILFDYNNASFCKIPLDLES